MGVVYQDTNYNGELDVFIYKVLGIELDVVEKEGTDLMVGVSTKTELDYHEAGENPLADYTEDAPDFSAGGSASFTVKKRELNPEKAMITLQLKPNDWIPVWNRYKATGGSFTEIRMNPAFQSEILDLIKRQANLQITKLFWQGDKSLAANDPMHFIDGLVKKIKADTETNVVFATPQGNITEATIVERLRDIYKLIPAEKLDDPNFTINLSTTDYRKLQLAENDVQKAFIGSLDTGLKNMFLNHRIKHYIGIPENHIIAANNVENFILSMYFNVNTEFGAVEVFKQANGSRKWGVRVDVMLDAQYRYGGHIVFYKPS